MSVAVALTFGSFGDITTILQLASALVTTLRASSSAADEITEVVTTIKTFSNTLKTVGGLNMAEIDPARQSEAEAARDGIQESLEICDMLLRRMTVLIEKHRRRIERRYGRQRWMRYWAACMWYLVGGKADADSLRRQLQEQHTAIQTMIAIITCKSSTAACEMLSRRGLNALNETQHSAESPSNRVKTAEVQFRFPSNDGKGLKPMLTMLWHDFRDLCAQFQFFGNKYAELEEDRFYTQTLYSSNGRKAWFQVYLLPDVTQPELRVVISPVLHILGKPNIAQRPAAGTSRSGAAVVPASIRFLAFTSKHDETFEEDRVSPTLSTILEHGYKWLKASNAYYRTNNDAQMRALDAPKARNLRLTISRVVGGDYRCTLATTSASHVVAVGSQYYGFDG